MKHDATAPSRWPAWKLLVLGVAAIPLLLFLAHGVWNSIERRRLADRVAAIRAIGEPMDAADYTYPVVPDDQNAALLIQAAAAALVTDDARDKRESELTNDDPHAFDAPLAAAPAALWRETLAANARALEAIAPVDQRPNADFGVRITSPAMHVLLPDLKSIREVANLLRAQAFVAHHDGRPRDAIEAIVDLDSIGSVTHKNFGLVSTLVGTGVLQMQNDAIVQIAPDLEIDDQSRRRVKMLIARLLNDALPLEMFEQAVLDERFFGYDTMNQLFTGTWALRQAFGAGTPPAGSTAGRIGESIAYYVVRPTLYRGTWRMTDYATQELHLCRTVNDLNTYRTQSAPVQRLRSETQASPASMLRWMMVANLERPMMLRYRLTTDRHLAATALALRLYAIDHAGQLPPTLDVLVPAYLPDVPTDAIDGRPIRYDAARKLIWSVGDNGTDEGGDETPPKPSQTERWKTADNVVSLVRRPKPATHPSAID